MRSGFPPWRLAPEPWVGLSVPYDPEWVKLSFAPAVDTRAFDKVSKTWWMPRSFEPVVSQMVREHTRFGIADEALQKARVELYRDRAHIIPGESAASDYALLALHPSCPPQLIEWAIAYWRQLYRYYGAPTTQLLQIEEAYQRIMARLAQPPPPPTPQNGEPPPR